MNDKKQHSKKASLDLIKQLIVFSSSQTVNYIDLAKRVLKQIVFIILHKHLHYNRMCNVILLLSDCLKN